MEKIFFALLMLTTIKSSAQKIEAENFTLNVGCSSVICTDAGGGRYTRMVGDGALTYAPVDLRQSRYVIRFRVASIYDGSRFFLLLDDHVIKVYDVPKTGGLQNWITITDTLGATAGSAYFKLKNNGISFGMNWFELVPVVDLSQRVLITLPNKGDSILLLKVMSDGTFNYRVVGKDDPEAQN